jgi:hypothetical protein
LFSALKTYTESKKLKSLEFARACSDDCVNYVQLLDAREEHLGSAAQYVNRLLKLDIQPALPLLLASYQKCSLADMEKLAKWILVFVARHAIIGGRDSSELETTFFKLARTIRKVEDGNKQLMATCLANAKKTLVATAPTDEQTKLALRMLILSSEEAAYILSRLANRMQTGTKEVALDESNVEHIFPKKPDEGKWGGKANHAILGEYLWHIGNLTMLGGRINSGMGNEEYAVKRERYEKRSELKMAQAVAKDYPGPKWDKATIEDRAMRLGTFVVEVWNFNNPSRV